MTFAESIYTVAMGVPLLYCAVCILYLLHLTLHALLLRSRLLLLAPSSTTEAPPTPASIDNPTRFVLFFPRIMRS